MDGSVWEGLLAKAAQVQVPEHLKSRMDRGEKLRVKFGMDPTAPDLHLGHLVVLDVLRDLQEAGHTIVIIVGDHTALIGDPSGRSQTRPVLTPQVVEANARTYFDQIYKVLDPARTEVHGNSEWLSSMDAAGVLQLMGKATLQQVLQREDFAERLRTGSPIGAHEILYPFNQAYDSVAVRADLEVGGSDQLFNLLFGREIQRGYSQEPQDIAVFPLLEGRDGSIKMSKSAGNHIGIAEAPAEIYGKIMSIPDHLTERYLRLIGRLPSSEVDRLLTLGPRDAKAALALRMVARLHGEDEAVAAEEDFRRRFRAREAPQEMEDHRPAQPDDLTGTMVEAGLASSRGEARRLSQQGGVRINGEKVTEASFSSFENSDVLQVGKRRFVRIRLSE
ncbi:MAG TPA: tyrosine--tRNA ligase [Candidatus Dormibacteraeota bacterium]|nr:tyrosine--tRNA ligase [Candidatus Dormibacteraeota bacterium]